MFKSTDIISILGRRGSGKSYLCKKIQTLYPRCIIFDTLHEYNDSDVDIMCYDFEDFSKAVISTKNKSKFRICFQFEIGQDNTDIFNECLKLIYHRGSVCVVIEEVQNFSETHAYGLTTWLKESLLTGRHRDIAIITTTQRAGQLHSAILSQSNHIFTGNLQGKSDLQNLSNTVGIDINIIKSLKEHTFIWHNLKFTKIVTNDLTKFVG